VLHHNAYRYAITRYTAIRIVATHRHWVVSPRYDGFFVFDSRYFIFVFGRPIPPTHGPADARGAPHTIQRQKLAHRVSRRTKFPTSITTRITTYQNKKYTDHVVRCTINRKTGRHCTRNYARVIVEASNESRITLSILINPTLGCSRRRVFFLRPMMYYGQRRPTSSLVNRRRTNRNGEKTQVHHLRSHHRR